MPGRSVRSFARRGHRLTRGQQGALDQFWSRYVLDVKDGLLDPAVLFPGCGRLILDIGFGAGEALYAMAQREPGTGFIGVDVYLPGVGRLLARLGEAGLGNVRIYVADVQDVLEHCIPGQCLSGVSLFYPDPWPKRRHHKRRLVQPSFLARLGRHVHQGGTLHMATDDSGYLTAMLRAVAETPAWFRLAPEKAERLVRARPRTRFECRAGMSGWDIVLERVGGDGCGLGE